MKNAITKRLLTFLVLTIALPILSTASTPQDSIPLSTQDTTIRSIERHRFNLAYTSLEYWFFVAKEQQKALAQKDSIIKTYAEETGLQAVNAEELKKVIRNNESIKDAECEERVEKAVEKSDRRKVAWRKTAIVAGVVAIAEGVIIYFISIL